MTHSSIRRWLEEHACIEPSLLEGAGLEAIVTERLTAFGGSEPAYVAELARSSDEVDRLLAGIAVPETWLFRYLRSYDLLLEFFQHRLTAGATFLRVASIGCATGQEPYCIAMAALHAGWSADRVRIEGFDRNREFLRTADAAQYSALSIRTEIPAWGVSFFNRSGDTIAIDPMVRALVRFTRADVTSPAALRGTGPWDVVFCRNILIYLNAAARATLLTSICAELAPGGLLFVGHAELVTCTMPSLRPVNAPHAFVLQLVGGSSPSLDRPRTKRALLNPSPLPLAKTAARPPAISPPATRPSPSPPPEDSLEQARDLADAGRVQDGEAMIRAIIARHGPSAPAMELLGMIRMSVNDMPAAKHLFEQAVYLEPTRSASLLQLALMSERAGDARRAAAYWDRARRDSAVDHQERRP